MEFLETVEEIILKVKLLLTEIISVCLSVFTDIYKKSKLNTKQHAFMKQTRVSLVWSERLPNNSSN